MEHTGSVVALLMAGAIVGFLAWRVTKEREKLQQVVQVLRDPRDPLVGALEELLHQGKLTRVGAA